MNMATSTIFGSITNKFSTSPVVVALIVSLLGILLTKFVLFLCREFRTWTHYHKIPGLPYQSWLGATLLGNIELYYMTMFHMTREKAITQLINGFYQIDSIFKSGFARLTIGPERILVVYRHDTVEKFITSMEFIEKSTLYRFFDIWLGKGLLTSTGTKWKQHRKLLTPAFHFKILDSFFPVMNDNTEIMMKRFDKIVAERGSVDIRSLIGDCTLDTICETAMGTTVGAQEENSKIDYINPLNQVLRIVMRRIMNPIIHNKLVWKLSPQGREYHKLVDKIMNFVKDVIQERKNNLEQTLQENSINLSTIGGQELETFTKKRYAFLDSLLLTHLQHPAEFTLQDILDEVNTFMFEGHDTTSMALIFTLMLVGSDERVQDKVQEELDSIYDGDEERQITLEDTRHMKYLEMVIKEGLRLYPSVPLFARKILQDVRMAEYTIPAGITVAFIPFILHRDPTVFPKPERFIPERFEPNSPIHKKPYAYIPFSAGPRNCIGQKFAMLEMKIILAAVLRKYRARSVSQRDELDVNFSVITKTETPVEVSFEKRRKND